MGKPEPEKELQVVLIRCKKYLVVDVPIFIRVHTQDEVSSKALGRQLLTVIQLVNQAAPESARPPAEPCRTSHGKRVTP